MGIFIKAVLTDGRMTTSEVARCLGITDRWVIRLHEQKVLKDVEVTRLGRLYSRTEVLALKAERGVISDDEEFV